MRGGFFMGLGVLTAIVLAALLFYVRLSSGPVSFGRLPERISEALASRIGPGWSVTLRDSAIELQDGYPALRANGLDIRDPNGTLVVRAPFAIVSVDGMSLLTASLQPRSIELRDLQIRALVAKDGSLTLVSEPSADGAGAPPPPEVAPAPTLPAPGTASTASPVSRIVGSLFGLVIGRTGVLTSLDRAQLTNARLTLMGADRTERATFRRVDATFSRDGNGHHFDARLDGQQGPWELGGDVSGDDRSGYRATLAARDAPVQDVLLLAGLSAVPAKTDLELSGRVDAAFGPLGLTELKASLRSGRGTVQIDDKDTSPLVVERSVVDVSWDEPTRVLNLNALEVQGGANDVRLRGRFSPFVSEKGWLLALEGRDVVLAGAAAGDPPVRLDTIEADLSGPDALVLNGVRLRGPSVSADISGVLLAAADPKALRLDVRGVGTDARTAVRLWPEAVAPPVRRFLVANLKAGRVETIDLKVDMTGDDVARAVSGGPIPDRSLRIDFQLAKAALTAADGLPPITKVPVTGVVTGTSVTLRAPSGLIEMGEGRSLQASEGTFDLSDYWNDAALARIAFRLKGGADGLGALLQSPRVHEIAGIDVDPSTMKGTTDLRVGIDLAVKAIPAFVDLPITVAGTATDLTVDKLFGRDRLDNAALSLAYDKGGLTIKGEGRLGGTPATFDVRKARGVGDANVALVLDEAARQRRGLSFAPQLTGSIGVKATMPLGKDAKPGIRIEADLARAAIDGLIPGWVKASGRPGKLSMNLVEGASNEIQDLQLDSGSVQLRGTATLTGDGSLDKADLSTFKLSPGDDMRAQIDRQGGIYKIAIRGNVGDARPFTKSLGSASPPAVRGAASKDSKDVKDFDLDLALNILTGHNDEAVTNATVKASVRKDTIRQLDLKGRLGATNLVSRTVSQGGGTPTIILQSEDAGSLLRFVDIYRRMTGGEMVLQMSAGDGPQTGNVLLREFTLVNEPALRRIIPTQTQIVAGQDAGGRPKTVQVDTNRIDFSKARVDFQRNAGRLDFKDAAIWGAAIGFTLGGYIDYPRDKLDISGTFVPAYGLNNAFAQVPLFGPLLGGSQYEGLFAVNFRVSGLASAPTLTVNPLSAVAPGFLRKLFGAGEAPQAGNPLPTTPER